MAKFTSKLAIGTANFGMNYGVNNVAGKLSDRELSKVLTAACEFGIRTFDTAQAYGDSEIRLEPFVQPNSEVITKIRVPIEKNSKPNEVRVAVFESLKNLNLDKLYGVLVHNPEELIGIHGSQILGQLAELKEQKVIKKIGVSIYRPELLGEIMKVFKLDIVQVPFNIFDQRILLSGWANKLKSNCVEIHARSAFLQGLLLVESKFLPEKFQSNWPELFHKWYDYQVDMDESADTIALNYCLQQPWIDKVVVGVDSADQLKRLSLIEKLHIKNNFFGFSVKDENLIDPSNWNRL